MYFLVHATPSGGEQFTVNQLILHFMKTDQFDSVRHYAQTVYFVTMVSGIVLITLGALWYFSPAIYAY